MVQSTTKISWNWIISPRFFYLLSQLIISFQKTKKKTGNLHWVELIEKTLKESDVQAVVLIAEWKREVRDRREVRASGGCLI